METIQELRDAVQDCKDAYLAIADTGTRAELREANLKTKAAQQALSDALCEGAKPCPTCGKPPRGLIQEDDRFGTLIEIGSPEVLHYRARGIDVESAVRQWNAGVDVLLERKAQLSEEELKANKPLVTLDESGTIVGLPPTWHAPRDRRPVQRKAR